jgi:NADPH-dependent glutamate synthase beta subunit-like oxidoreductase/ferredoxin
MRNPDFPQIPLFIPHSNTSTAQNKTGSWRFFHPRYAEKTAPCSAACPLGQDIARIEMLTSRGLFKDAWHAISEENPFPAVCGRVCFHPCEGACNRSRLDDPIAIHHLERFLGDAAISQQRRPDLGIKRPRDKKVAVAGAGPSGLSAAYFLAQLGYACDVFEAAAEPGGLLRLGIPTYRLPRDILDHEIKRIAQLGVNIFCRTPVTLNLLEKIHIEYDALFIGCGYARPIALTIEGGHLARDGLDFLRRLQREEIILSDGRTAVIGGGNTAIDVARCLVRLGASPLIVYRRRREDMPAFEPEIEMALAEGVEILELAAPIRIEKNQSVSSSAGAVYALTLQQMKPSSGKIGGRARVLPDGEKTKTIQVRNIFAAIGAEAESLWHFPAAGRTRTISLSHCKISQQKIPHMFGGDLTSPVKSVADAVASGKQAAMALDTYFEKGFDAVESRLAACRVGTGPALSMNAYLGENRRSRSAHIVSADQIVLDYFHSAPRVSPAALSADRRRRSFAEIESTLSADAAGEEAARCFSCGTCNACDYCRLYCPEMAVKVENDKRSIDLDYCKGCGVCATECPRNAMVLEEEIK